MHKILFFSSFITLIFIHSITAQNSGLLLRFPSLSPDGTHMTFSYQGDIWTASTSGGEAKRITIHEAYETLPQWSPSNDQISFISNRHGNNDVFVMNSNGSNLLRLNYHSASDSWPRWTTDGHITFSSRRNFVQVERNAEIHSIPINGGTPHRILNAVGNMATTSPNGNLIAFVRGTCRNEREAYTGPAQKDIWIYNKENSSYYKITQSTSQDIAPDFGSENKLYYLSAESGRYNIYCQNLDTNGMVNGNPEQITNHMSEGIRSFDVSANGKHIIYEHGTDVYFMENMGQAKAIQVIVSEDYRFYPTEKKTLTGNITDYSLSPDEKYIAFSARGEVFIKKNDKDKKDSKNLTNHPYREKNAEWLNDSTLLFLSDRVGNYDLYLIHSSDSTEQNLYKSFKYSTRKLTNTPEDEKSFVLSHDKKQIAITSGIGKLIVADIDEKGLMSNQKVLLDGWDDPESIRWSPDNQWLAYSLEDLNFNEEVYIHAADNNKDAVNISLHPRSDSRPVWSKDGSKLGFISIRNNGDADVWFTWLSKADWEKSKKDWEDEDEEEEKPKEKKEKKEEADSTKKAELITIDFEDIHERLQQVTRLPGDESNLLIDHEGEFFYYTSNGSGKRELKKTKWDGTESKTVLSKGSVFGLSWDKKGKKLYAVQSGGKMASIKVEGEKLENLPHSAKMIINKKEEWSQIFEEAWRTLRDGFYDPGYHGQDFVELKTKYKERAIHASTSQDFRTMVNEMLGQLNASHMGLYRTPNPEETQKDLTGYIGVEVKPVAQGVQILHIIPDSPADKQRSKLNIGDVITNVNGVDISQNVNFYQLLDDARNERILLNITVADSTREVIIRPTSSLSSLLYEEWVDNRKELVNKYSNGRLGYIHIKAMGWSSFERFERELMASGNGKEGIVIDVRYNGGGWTTDMLMAVLDVRQHAYTIPRGAANSLENQHKEFKEFYPFGERLPLSWWTKPSIAMCNESSYSNAEIFSHAYKTLGLGTLVGKPTFGAVISTGSQTLIDGSYVRLPFRGWYVKATEKNMEFEPAIPHIEVEDLPDAKAKGEDPQLKRAVEELLKELDEE